jgi:hypothetical protein
MNSVEGTPAIPQRAVSHSKKAHEQLARQRSMNSMHSSPRHSREHRASREQRTSADFFKGTVELNHPFGKELEQLNEVAEELNGVVADATIEQDVIYMRNHGLAKFSADDYMALVMPLYSGMFDKRIAQVQAGWI